MVYFERPEVVNRIRTLDTGELDEELVGVHETLDIIDEALSAPDFHEADRAEVEKSRAFFEGRRQLLRQVLAGESITRTYDALVSC